MQNPKVVVPMDTAMAREPARTIAGQTAPATTAATQAQYGTVDRIKLFVTALLGLLAVVGVNVAPGVADQVQDAITYGAPLATMAYAWWQTERTKREAIATAVTDQANVQAEATRSAVYAPATVADIVAAERPTNVDAVVIDAPPS